MTQILVRRRMVSYSHLPTRAVRIGVMVAGRRLRNYFEAPEHNTRPGSPTATLHERNCSSLSGIISAHTLSPLRSYRLQNLNVLLPRYSYQMRKKDFTDTPD